MLRHILQDIEWAITVVIITLIVFMIISNLTIQPAIATITETDIAPAHLHCRSEQILTDETGYKWEIMLFTNVKSDVTPFTPTTNNSLNLRLSGLSGSPAIESQKPLIIKTTGDRYEAKNTFLDKSPLPTIGQYDLKKIFPQLSGEELRLEVPLENGKTTYLHIPQAVVQEWQEIAAKNPSVFPKQLPSGLELAC